MSSWSKGIWMLLGMQKNNDRQLNELGKWFRDEKFYSEKLISDEKKLLSKGGEKTLELFKGAAKYVPAYRDFLRKNRVNPDKIRTLRDFEKVPVTAKSNYVVKYPIDKRCWNGELSLNHMISTSSGTTGKPHYWPRNQLTEIDGAYPHEFIFKNILEIQKKKVLFVNGFAMGNWIAGTFTLACTTLVAFKGYSLTTMTPGYSTEAIIEVLRDIPKYFDLVIITGHTPFLKKLIEEGNKRKINWKKLNKFFLGTGQGVTENWREYVIKISGSKDYHRTFLNLYGSADAALMGFETPLTIYLRKFLSDSSQKIKEIFNDERLPSIYQFDPRLIHIEQQEKELILTKYSGAPLIKYNIHDHGDVVNFSQMFEKINMNTNIRKLEKSLNYRIAKFPFVYLFGREKFMIKIYGANIYTEHVLSALNHSKLQPHLTGRFLLESNEDKDHNPQLICRVELSPDVAYPKAKLTKIVQKIFISEVAQLNTEYNFLLNELGKKVWPKIFLYHIAHPKYFPKDKIKKTA